MIPVDCRLNFNCIKLKKKRTVPFSVNIMINYLVHFFYSIFLFVKTFKANFFSKNIFNISSEIRFGKLESIYLQYYCFRFLNKSLFHFVYDNYFKKHNLCKRIRLKYRRGKKKVIIPFKLLNNFL